MLHFYVSFTVARILHIISFNKLSQKCLMLVITPVESFSAVKFFKFIPPNNEAQETDRDAVQSWYLDLFATYVQYLLYL